LPRPIVERLNAELARALKLPDVRERFASQGAEPVGSTPEQHDAFIRREVAKWIKVVKDAGIHVE
jgi:tripartite-type tricarboxylate transporter receptor subunit TctC